jgi:hypothetical protein
MSMKSVTARRVILSFAFVAAANLLVPNLAQATDALFRIKRSWHTNKNDWYYDYEPATKGPNKAPPEIGSVGTATPVADFTLPRGFINTTVTWYCNPGTCYKGYPVSGGIYSSENLQGRFRPNNPHGATTTTVLRFPTTMSATLPPSGMGDPITPTTTWGGRYDFSRGGSMQVWPGTNRFGGTMRYFFGPNGTWYQYITASSPYVSKGYGGYTENQRTELDESDLFEWNSGGQIVVYRMTGAGIYRATSLGEYITRRNQYINTSNPWTTGKVRAHQPLGTYVTTFTFSGSSSPSPTGSVYGLDLTRKVSMVRPRLRHTYSKRSDPQVPLGHIWAAARVWVLDVYFFGEAPEPAGLVMLGSGVVILAGLYRLRRR